MKKLTVNLLMIFISFQVFGQNKSVSSEILSQTATTKIFTDSLIKQLNITYPIRRVYKCIDISGQFFIVLTESNDTVTADNDTLNYNIKAYNIADTKNGLIKKWEIKDFKIKQTNNNWWETSIWFWTKYSEFQDLDSDNFIDPILVYGTEGANGTDDGRIKIITYYKGEKIAIRHQNGVLDNDRNTQVDKEFYSLPIKIQDKVKEIIQKMIDNGHAIFPYGWQEAMNRKEIKFDENK